MAVMIALDMMGGDNRPDCNLEGALDALKKDPEICVSMVGPEDIIASRIAEWNEGIRSRIRIVHAPEVITPEEAPVMAVRRKKDSSLSVGARMIRDGEAAAFISAGSTGAVLAAGQLIAGRLPGVLRPPLATMVPTKKGPRLFLDLGANVDAKPEWLCQFAQMGSLYMEKVQNYERPVVKLVNLGTEEEKGNALVKAVHPMLKEMESINYQGFIESRDVIMGEADVIVADAFTGNAILKTIEGTVEFTLSVLKEVFRSSLMTKLAAALVMKPLKRRMKAFSSSEHGGAMLLGLNGLVMKCHGNATRGDICNSILKCAEYARKNVGSVIREAFEAAAKEEERPAAGETAKEEAEPAG